MGRQANAKELFTRARYQKNATKLTNLRNQMRNNLIKAQRLPEGSKYTKVFENASDSHANQFFKLRREQDYLDSHKHPTENPYDPMFTTTNRRTTEQHERQRVNMESERAAELEAMRKRGIRNKIKHVAERDERVKKRLKQEQGFGLAGEYSDVAPYHLLRHTAYSI